MIEPKEETGTTWKDQDHTDSLAYYNGREALDAAKYTDAANNFTLLIERHPKDPQYRWMRAKAYYGMGAWELCRLDCERVTAMGLALPEVEKLTGMSLIAQHKEASRDAGRVSGTQPVVSNLSRTDFGALLALRHDYRLRSLLINADERLAEADYDGVLEIVSLAERLLNSSDASGDLAFDIGLFRVRACIGAGRQSEALEVINFYIKHAQSTGKLEYVREFKIQRSLVVVD